MGMQACISGGRDEETLRQSEMAGFAVVTHGSCILCHPARCNNGRRTAALSGEAGSQRRLTQVAHLAGDTRKHDLPLDPT